jgi:predicted peroxiredoxin
VAKILVHVTTGPENPTKAALAFLVARAAAEEGHDVAMFLAGDATQLLRDSVLDSLIGLGTGSLRDSYDAVVAGDVALYASGMSSKARGVAESDLDGKPVEFATPNRLVELAVESDRVITY